MPTPPLTLQSTAQLPNSSLRMPLLGFGVYQSPTSTCVQSCLTALSLGYRHFDTAQFYRNETQVGEALRKSGLSRSDVFMTTKILSSAGSVDKSYQKCVDSVKKIDPGSEGEEGYVDLFLIHSPSGGASARKEMWLALERLQKEGRAKSIGVSNFGIAHIEEMKGYATVWPPAANQIELHPWCQQREIVEYCKTQGIVVQAYSPLVRNYRAGDETLGKIAKGVGRTGPQVLIRYALQKGWVPLPKSDDPGRIEANADVFGFELGAEQIETLDDLDRGSAGAVVQAVTNS